MNALLDSLYSFCSSKGLSRTYWIAFSGGLDSTVLLALCDQLAKKHTISFQVVHVDHGLQTDSKSWAHFAKRSAARYQLPYTHKTITRERRAGESIEAYAREARYAIFKDLMQVGDVLLTAHHEDDQAETVLLQLMRGAGVKGLSAMPSVKPLGRGFLGRPLLAFSREDLQAYAVAQGLTWIDDTSNGDTAFSRNYLRHEIMPRLKERWPKAPQMLARSAANCALVQDTIDDYLGLLEVSGVRDGTMSVSKLMGLTQAMRFLLLRQWIMKAGYYPPDQKKLHTIETSVLKSRWDKNPCVVLGDGVMVRRYRDDLYLDEVGSHVVQSLEATTWYLADSECNMPSIGHLQSVLAPDGMVPSHIASLDVRFLPPSATIAVMGRGRGHSVKNLFQEWGVPPWLRHRTPLLFLKDELVGVPGYYWSPVLQYDQSGLAKFKIIFHAYQSMN